MGRKKLVALAFVVFCSSAVFLALNARLLRVRSDIATTKVTQESPAGCALEFRYRLRHSQKANPDSKAIALQEHSEFDFPIRIGIQTSSDGTEMLSFYRSEGGQPPVFVNGEMGVYSPRNTLIEGELPAPVDFQTHYFASLVAPLFLGSDRAPATPDSHEVVTSAHVERSPKQAKWPNELLLRQEGYFDEPQTMSRIKFQRELRLTKEQGKAEQCAAFALSDLSLEEIDLAVLKERALGQPESPAANIDWATASKKVTSILDEIESGETEELFQGFSDLSEYGRRFDEVGTLVKARLDRSIEGASREKVLNFFGALASIRTHHSNDLILDVIEAQKEATDPFVVQHALTSLNIGKAATPRAMELTWSIVADQNQPVETRSAGLLAYGSLISYPGGLDANLDQYVDRLVTLAQQEGELRNAAIPALGNSQHPKAKRFLEQELKNAPDGVRRKLMLQQLEAWQDYGI